MSPRLFLHGDSIVSPSSHSPRRLDGLSGSAGRLPAGSYSSRFASLSSLLGRRMDVPVQGPLLRSHNRTPSLHEDYGSHFRHPPQVWTIDSSWPIQNSSLVYLGVEIRSLPFMARPPPVRVSNLLRLLEEFLSTPSPPASLWHRILGHLSSLTMRLLQPFLKDQWDFLDDQFQVSWSPLCREFLLWWTRVAQLREGVSFSLPVPDVSFLSDASDVGCGPSWANTTPRAFGLLIRRLSLST